MVEDKLKVVILSDEDSHLYELYYAKSPKTFVDYFENINEVISFCKERNFDIVSDFEN